MEWSYLDLREVLLEKIKQRGGWVNAHAHIDRCFIINKDNYHLRHDTLPKKWDYTDQFKIKASVDEIVAHMSRALDGLLAQGGQAMGTFIDCDSVVKDKNLKAAEIIRSRYKGQIKITFMHQPIKGLVNPTERKWFEEAATFVDILGGLPERDSEIKIGTDRKVEHLDILFEAAKKHNKPIHIHVDQFNHPDQRDTELCITKAREHNWANRVTLVHCLSVAAQPRERRQKIYSDMAELGISVISCPTSWIDVGQPRPIDQDVIGPLHNSITPVHEMVKAGIKVGLGTDGIADIYKPFTDGDMWTELRFLLEACHFYELDTLADIATVNGLKTLHLE